VNGDATTDALECVLGRVLRVGVRVSAVLLGLGLGVFSSGYAPPVADTLFHAGLVTLMATPMLRVVISVVEYARARDWLYLATTGAVLLVLIGTVVVAVMEYTARQLKP
jgi:uncharacterized membrane protein